MGKSGAKKAHAVCGSKVPCDQVRSQEIGGSGSQPHGLCRGFPASLQAGRLNLDEPPTPSLRGHPMMATEGEARFAGLLGAKGFTNERASRDGGDDREKREKTVPFRVRREAFPNRLRRGGGGSESGQRRGGDRGGQLVIGTGAGHRRRDRCGNRKEQNRNGEQDGLAKFHSSDFRFATNVINSISIARVIVSKTRRYFRANASGWLWIFFVSCS